MRTKSFIPLLGFMLLLMAVSCSDPIEVNPNYNPETKEVLTNVVMNFSTAIDPQTKQSAAAVQKTDFRGISDAKLLSYKLASDNIILTADATADKLFKLDDVVGSTDISNKDSRRVLEMSLPLETNTLLFYGRANKKDMSSENPNYTRDDSFGYMSNFNVGQTEGDVLITLGRRLREEDEEQFKLVEDYFASLLSAIMNISYNGEAINATAIPDDQENCKPYKYTITKNKYGYSDDNPLHWWDYAYVINSGSIEDRAYSPIDVNESLYPLEQKLSNAYKQMTTIKSASNELRAASGYALIRTIQDLWSIVNQVRCAEPLNEAETIAKFLATKINDTIYSFFAGSFPANGTSVSGVAFRNISATLRSVYANLSFPYADQILTDDKLASLTDFPFINFPAHFNIPRGATHMRFNSENKYFYYPSSFNVSEMGTVYDNGDFNEKSYYFPAELMYFGNSPIRTSNVEKKVSDYPNGVGTDAGQWHGSTSWGEDWSIGHVLSSTRAVAMMKDINYGTALMETKVQYASGITKMYDNRNHIFPSEQNQVIPIKEGEAGSFILTGIIIGSQPRDLGWNFLPKAVKDAGETAETIHYGFVYDKVINSSLIPTPANSPTYTMLLDSYIEDNTQHTINVALEFQNKTGNDFYGNENLIRNDGYFYLIGLLDPAGKTITWPSEDFYVYPPYNAEKVDGKFGKQIPRVFIQDFLTSVTFTLGENSLKHAYLTVPDLRSGSISLGLSVDIKWETGMSFEVLLGSDDPTGNPTGN